MAEELNSLLIRLGANVKKIREAKNMSQGDVASGTNTLDATKISKIERGQFNLELKTIVDLCNGLGVTAPELFNFK